MTADITSRILKYNLLTIWSITAWRGTNSILSCCSSNFQHIFAAQISECAFSQQIPDPQWPIQRGGEYGVFVRGMPGNSSNLHCVALFRQAEGIWCVWERDSGRENYVCRQRERFRSRDNTKQCQRKKREDEMWFVLSTFVLDRSRRYISPLTVFISSTPSLS